MCVTTLFLLIINLNLRVLSRPAFWIRRRKLRLFRALFFFHFFFFAIVKFEEIRVIYIDLGWVLFFMWDRVYFLRWSVADIESFAIKLQIRVDFFIDQELFFFV